MKPPIRQISDLYQAMRLLVAFSRLKSDGPSFKGQFASTGMCSNGDSFEPETIRHVLMQCPLIKPRVF